jgi:DNA mismatch endonuclease (patch repair protein)
MIVRRLVHGMGYRYRLHVKDLPGCPDLVFKKLRKIIQVYGCYWHPHGRGTCKYSHHPKSRLDYWVPKLEGNRQRDRQNNSRLRRRGWHVLVIRECETEERAKLEAIVAAFLEG